MKKQKQKQGAGGSSTDSVNNGEHKLDFKSIMKDIGYLGSTHMTWKEKKDLENKKVMSLGGKPPKRQRLPLSVARVVMKKQKEREAKMEQENLVLGRFARSYVRDGRKTDRRKPEDRVLKSSEGHFRNGVLDVKNLLRPSTSRANDEDRRHLTDKKKTKKKKKGSKKNHGKKNGRGMRR